VSVYRGQTTFVSQSDQTEINRGLFPDSPMRKIQMLRRDKLLEIGLWRDASRPAWEL